jgi:8-oxo-dGTP diphosphatase
MPIVQLCSGILRRGDTVLLTRCAYEGEPEALWTLPGGRQEKGETKTETIVREFREETSLRVKTGSLAYVSESIDPSRELHVLNCTFFVDDVDATARPGPRDPRVVDARFMPVARAPEILRADVLRIPFAAALGGDPARRYFFFREADVVEPFFRGAPRTFEG